MIETIAGAAISAILGSDGAKKAGKEFSNAVWDTIKPWLIKEDEPTPPAVQAAVSAVEAATPVTEQQVAVLKNELTNYLGQNPQQYEALQALLQRDAGTQQYIQNAKTIYNNPSFNSGGGDINFS